MSETPAERGLRLAQENPELLNSLTENLFYSERTAEGVHQTDMQDEWDEMPEYERATWREKVLVQLHHDADLPDEVLNVVRKVQQADNYAEMVERDKREDERIERSAKGEDDPPLDGDEWKAGGS